MKVVMSYEHQTLLRKQACKDIFDVLPMVQLVIRVEINGERQVTCVNGFPHLQRKSSLKPNRQLIANLRPIEDRGGPVLRDVAVHQKQQFPCCIVVGNAPFVFVTLRTWRL